MLPRILIGVSVAVIAGAQPQPRPTNDDLIVPGVRVGAVSSNSTQASLHKALGKAIAEKDTEVGGEFQPSSVIYDDDPTRRLVILWNDEKPAHPRVVLICFVPMEAPCRWH